MLENLLGGPPQEKAQVSQTCRGPHFLLQRPTAVCRACLFPQPPGRLPRARPSALQPNPTLPTPPPAKSSQSKSSRCAPGPGLQAFLHRTMQLVIPRNLQTIHWQHGKLLKGHNSHTCQNRVWGRLAAWYKNKHRSRNISKTAKKQNQILSCKSSPLE